MFSFFSAFSVSASAPLPASQRLLTTGAGAVVMDKAACDHGQGDFLHGMVGLTLALKLTPGNPVGGALKALHGVEGKRAETERELADK